MSFGGVNRLDTFLRVLSLGPLPSLFACHLANPSWAQVNRYFNC